MLVLAHRVCTKSVGAGEVQDKTSDLPYLNTDSLLTHSHAMQASLMEERATSIMDVAMKFQVPTHCLYADIPHLAGMIAEAIPVVKMGMLRYWIINTVWPMPRGRLQQQEAYGKTSE